MMNIDIWLENLRYIVFSLYGLSALLSVVFYYKYKNTALKYFPVLLIVTLILEYSGQWLYDSFGFNALFYNINNTIYFLYFFYVFWCFIHEDSFKKWIVCGVILFLLSNLINPFFEDYTNFPQLLVYMIGGVLLIFCIILYYIEILTTSKILVIQHDILFWISVGLLLFYVGYLPIKFIRSYFADIGDMYNTLKVMQWFLIIIMHTCFIIGFIWTKKKSRD